MMWLAMQPSISALRADALFVSALQRSDDPSAAQVRHAIAAAVREYGGQGCAERVAQEFGDHPETAVVRMRWARALASEAFRGSAAEPSARRDARSFPKGRPGSPAVTRVRPAA
jgi:hypothetical protein